jgi:hypothetical protein
MLMNGGYFMTVAFSMTVMISAPQQAKQSHMGHSPSA